MKLRNIITTSGLVLLGSGAVSASTYLYVCQSCPAGTYGDGTEESCIPCGKGTYSAGNTGSCTPCAKGTSTNDKTGQASCSLCTGRTYTDKTGQATCSSCSDGTRVNADHTGCVTCSAGTYSNNGTTCEPCKGESYSNWSSEECGTISRTKTTYCASSGSTYSTDKSSTTTETSTRSCQSGYSCNNGKCVIDNCSAGQYRSGTSCVTCEVGYYCPGDNLRYTCSTCLDKYYQSFLDNKDGGDWYRRHKVTFYCQTEGSTSSTSNSYECKFSSEEGKAPASSASKAYKECYKKLKASTCKEERTTKQKEVL